MPTSKWEIIGPKKAAAYLEHNNDNRPCRSKWSDQLAEAMVNGEFQENGETIKFNCDGGLADGQHRLDAIIKSQTKQRMLVVRGVSRDAFDTLDQGKKRTISDVLARHGEVNYTTLATAVRFAWCYENGWTVGGSRRALRSVVAVDVLERHPKLRDSVAFACHHEMGQVTSPGYAAGMHYFCHRLHQKMADEFWSKLGTGEGLTRQDQAYILRRRLIKDRMSGQGTAKLSRDQINVFCIKSWNALRAGKIIKSLKWADGEDFPVFK